VSNAAERSKKIRAATSPRSTAKRMSDNTRKTAVSVEWPGLNPLWLAGSRSVDCRLYVLRKECNKNTDDLNYFPLHNNSNDLAGRRCHIVASPSITRLAVHLRPSSLRPSVRPSVSFLSVTLLRGTVARGSVLHAVLLR